MLQGHLERPHIIGGNWGSLLATLVSFMRELRMDSEGSLRRIFIEVKRKTPGQEAAQLRKTEKGQREPFPSLPHGGRWW